MFLSWEYSSLFYYSPLLQSFLEIIDSTIIIKGTFS